RIALHNQSGYLQTRLRLSRQSAFARSPGKIMPGITVMAHLETRFSSPLERLCVVGAKPKRLPEEAPGMFILTSFQQKRAHLRFEHRVAWQLGRGGDQFGLRLSLLSNAEEEFRQLQARLATMLGGNISPLPIDGIVVILNRLRHRTRMSLQTRQLQIDHTVAGRPFPQVEQVRARFGEMASGGERVCQP